MIGVIVNGHEIALYEMDGDIFATDDICTHAYAKLSDGWMEKGEIECPLHAGRFDIKTGKATAPPVHRKRQDLSGARQGRRDSGQFGLAVAGRVFQNSKASPAKNRTMIVAMPAIASDLEAEPAQS